jgi:hypothetical protein
MGNKPPQEQTIDEWLDDHAQESGHGCLPNTPEFKAQTYPVRVPSSELKREPYLVSSTESSEKALYGEFKYIEHRTTKYGRLVLEFMHAETNEPCSMFFNVSIGNQKGKRYPAGRHGQFTVKNQRKIKQFWISIFKKLPDRWSRAHGKLRRMKKMKFTGKVIKKYKKDGSGSYLELVELNCNDE